MLSKIIARKCYHLRGLTYVQVRSLIQSLVKNRYHEYETKDASSQTTVYEQRAKKFLENLDDELIERKKEIEELIEVWRCENRPLPNEMKEIHWLELLMRPPTYSACSKYLERLWLTEQSRIERMEAKLEEERLIEENNEIIDHLYHLDPQRDFQIYSWQKLRAVMAENPIVIDLNFPNLSAREKHRSVHKIIQTLKSNALSLDPLRIHLTSFRTYPRMADYHDGRQTFVAALFHEEHFLDLFPREKIMYLSPSAPPLQEFNDDDIYVIGGCQDHMATPVSTYSYAKEMNLRCGSFPLSSYVQMQISAARTLNIRTSVDIVHCMYGCRNWPEALRESLNPAKYTVVDEIQPTKNSSVWKERVTKPVKDTSLSHLLKGMKKRQHRKEKNLN